MVVITNFLIHVEGIQVLQWCCHHARRDVPIDEGQTFARLQVTVGSGLVLVIVVTVTAVWLRWRLGFLLSDALFNFNQTFPGKVFEAVRSWRCNKGCSHVFILQQLLPLLCTLHGSQIYHVKRRELHIHISTYNIYIPRQKLQHSLMAIHMYFAQWLIHTTKFVRFFFRPLTLALGVGIIIVLF